MAKSCLSCDELDVANPKFQGEVTYEEECDSCLSQLKSSGLNAKSEYSSGKDDGSVVGMSSYQSDATWEEERNDESVFSHEDEGMISCSKY